VAQKRAIRAMLRMRPGSSCKKVFRELGILTVPSLFIYAMVMFVIENENNYPTNKSVHNMNTRAQNRLHVSSARLSIIQNGVCHIIYIF
jgi:hypothetical protein